MLYAHLYLDFQPKPIGRNSNFFKLSHRIIAKAIHRQSLQFSPIKFEHYIYMNELFQSSHLFLEKFNSYNYILSHSLYEFSGNNTNLSRKLRFLLIISIHKESYRSSVTKSNLYIYIPVRSSYELFSKRNPNTNVFLQSSTAITIHSWYVVGILQTIFPPNEIEK